MLNRFFSMSRSKIRYFLVLTMLVIIGVFIYNRQLATTEKPRLPTFPSELRQFATTERTRLQSAQNPTPPNGNPKKLCAKLLVNFSLDNAKEFNRSCQGEDPASILQIVYSGDLHNVTLTQNVAREVGKKYDVSDLEKNQPCPTADKYLFAMLQSGSKPRLISQKATPLVHKQKHDPRLKVPNVVHYVRFGGEYQFTFFHYLSYLSVSKFVKPWFIFLHSDALPTGKWWELTVETISDLYHVETSPPQEIYGRKFHYVEHRIDVTRLRLLIEHGGMYFDQDVLVLKPVEPLRMYDVTLGRERSDGLLGAIMFGRAKAPFLRIWMEAYHSFNPFKWAPHSIEMPSKLAKLFPHLIHVEERSLAHPSWMELDYLYGSKHYDWSANFALHAWNHMNEPIPASPFQINALNTTLGQVMRYVYYGSKELRTAPVARGNQNRQFSRRFNSFSYSDSLMQM